MEHGAWGMGHGGAEGGSVNPRPTRAKRMQLRQQKHTSEVTRTAAQQKLPSSQTEGS